MSVPVHKQRRGTAAAMAAANELPAPGQIYFELDTNRVKIGDGTRRYNDLPYLDLKSIAQLPGLQAALDSKASNTDPRLTDARTPTAHTHDDLYYRDAEVDSLLAGKVGQDDARLTNSRTPTSHAASHAAGGADEITPTAIGAAPSSHAHDDRYYTETETNTLLAGKQATGNYVVEGDSRLTDARTPTTHGHSAAEVTSGTFAIGRIPLGTTSSTVCVGNDARLSDQRTPLDNSVTTEKILNGSVTEEKIQNASVATPKIANGAVKLPKIDAAAQADLRDRQTHTGTQAISTITGLQTALDGKQATGNYSLVGHTHPLSSLEQSSATTGQVVTWNGTAWAAATPVSGGGSFTGGTLTSQLVLAGNTSGIDLSFTGSPTTGIRLRAADSIALMTTSADRFVVTSGGAIGLNVVPGGNWNLTAGRGISGTGGSILVSPTVSSAMTTGVAYGTFTQVHTAVGSTVTTLYGHFVQEIAAQRLGTVGSQVAYMVASSWVGGASSFGFRSDIPEGVGRYNFYAGGTALNQFLGMTLLSGGARVKGGTSASVLGLAFENDTNTGLWSPLADNLAFVTNGVERLRLDAEARCRISTGTSDISAYSTGMDDLIIGDGAGGRGLIISSGATDFASVGFTRIGQSSRGYVQYLNGSDYMRFGTAAVERMRISSTGNVGIGLGNADSAHRLHVDGTIRATNLTDGTTTRTVTDLLACVKQSDVDASISALVDAAPATLNTLNELAAALNDDPSFATTVTNSIAAKVGSNTTQAGGGTTVTNMVVISQAAYNALATKDSNTVYLLFDAGTPPNAPTSLTATAGNAQLSLSWTAPSAPGTSAITGYVVEYTPSGGSASTVNTNSTSTTYTLTGLTNGTSYTVRVAAISAVGTGDYSATATGTPAALGLVKLTGNYTGAGTQASPFTGSTRSAGELTSDLFRAEAAGTIYWTFRNGGNSSGDYESSLTLTRGNASVVNRYANGFETPISGSFAVSANQQIGMYENNSIHPVVFTIYLVPS